MSCGSARPSPEQAVEVTEAAVEALEPGDVVLVIGTSGLVYPAAGYPAMARAEGATVIEINPHESEISDMCHHVVRGPAAEVLAAIVGALR
ncbi:hypothetical protein LP422_07175 [Janibacter limosus]|uniref:Uncharacterized protein n=1 Tax=Janibacter limosus TaxID=53458 RepID=A0AC61U9N8_9MICO|nr:hypothetical protein [Janibacter limosus]UUZ46506.1 hypothetical protein LP422_07175 [Janibacter limosus]